MIPTLSHLSVDLGIDGCLRLWCSFPYLSIPPLHRKFHRLPPDPSDAVQSAHPELSPGLSHSACATAYMPFTPSNSEQRSPLTYYRGCWHVISRGLFLWYRHHLGISSKAYSSHRKGVYNTNAFILHAASLRQGFPHCGIFLAAASRRSRDRVSVPLWPATLSSRLPVLALVSHYLTNKLIGRRLIPRHSFEGALILRYHPVLPKISLGYPRPRGRFLRVTHPFATRHQ